MVRTPILPFEDCLSLFDSKDSDFISSLTEERLSLLLEAIFVASPSLYQAMMNKDKLNQAKPSLVKYIS